MKTKPISHSNRLAELFAIFVLMVFAINSLADSVSSSSPLTGVKRVLFLGDSITYQGAYTEDIEAWFVTRFPNRQIEFINVGLPSETVSGLSEPDHLTRYKFARPDLHERLDRVLAQTKPDYVIACYGMNDGIYLPFDEGRFEKYAGGIGWLREKCLAAGARVLLVTPPVYDEASGKNPGYRHTLDRYAEWLVAQRTNGWDVADLHQPMSDYLDAHRQSDPKYFLAKDGIHPSDVGHWIMAKQILLQLGAKDVANHQSPETMVATHTNGAVIFSLIQDRQRMMKDAWLTATGHKRPGMTKGLPLVQAQARAAEMEKQIRNLSLGLDITAKNFLITEYGAKADGITINTVAIQSAIDDCNKAGGGKVVIPAGRFVTGTLYLKSNVHLFLQSGAELLGSRSLADYPKNNPGSGEVAANRITPEEGVLTASEFIQALIVADQSSNIAIEGAGTIDGRGQPDAFPARIPGQKALGSRPMLMRFVKCRNLRFESVTLKNPASWGVHLVDCDNVQMRSVIIRHRSNENNDGIDIDGCRNVVIADSDISSGDDAICPKSSFGRPSENIFVTNCVISSDTAAFKCGTSSRAGFRNIVVTDCVMRDVKMCAIKLTCVDGGTLENVLIKNIVMNNVEGPLFIRLGNRGSAFNTPEPDGSPVKVGILRNITISNIQATVIGNDRSHWGIMITGIPNHPVEDIKLQDWAVSFPGGGLVADAGIKPIEDEKRYPEQFFFGVLPSWAVYIRHARGVLLEDMRFRVRTPDARPAFVTEDVKNIRQFKVSTNDDTRVPSKTP